jgi:hypothetical protein
VSHYEGASTRSSRYRHLPLKGYYNDNNIIFAVLCRKTYNIVLIPRGSANLQSLPFARPRAFATIITLKGTMSGVPAQSLLLTKTANGLCYVHTFQEVYSSNHVYPERTSVPNPSKIIKTTILVVFIAVCNISSTGHSDTRNPIERPYEQLC